MATHGVFLASRMQSQNIDALNRNAVSEVDVDNGMAVILGELSTDADKSQVFVATLPTATTDKGIWIVDEPHEPIAQDALGEEYSVGIKDPRKFYIQAGKVFAVRKPQIGDIFKISADMVSVANTISEGDESTPTPTQTTQYITLSTNGKYVLASSKGTGFAGKIIENSYFSIGIVSPDLSQRVDAYLVEVVEN